MPQQQQHPANIKTNHPASQGDIPATGSGDIMANARVAIEIMKAIHAAEQQTDL